MANIASTLPFTASVFADSQADIARMRQLQLGDSTALESLFLRHRRWIHNHLFRMVKNAAAAEDLTQEVFLRVYRARGNYQATAKFTTWLFQIAANLAANWLRDHRRYRTAATLEEAALSRTTRHSLRVSTDPEKILLRRERDGRIRQAIARLPERQRAAVVMHKYEELDYAAIAERLGCSVSAVKSLVNRAYISLREDLMPVVVQ